MNRTNRLRNVPQIHQRHDFVRYLQWLHGVVRLQLQPAMTNANIGEGDSSDEDIVDDYDEFTRTGTQPERTPINAYYGRQLARMSNEAGRVLMLQEGSQRSFQRLRGFAELIRRQCRRMAAKMSCVAATGEVVQPGSAQSGYERATTSGATTSASAAHDEDPEEDEEEGSADEAAEAEEDVDASIPDEMLLVDLVGAPPPMQPTQATPPRRKRRDRTDISSVNVVEGTRGPNPVARFTPGSGARRKRK